MQISGAGEGGRVAGREPARPARAVAHEPFRLGEREAARAVRTTPREADAPARPGSEAKSADTRNEAGSAEARQAGARQADDASEARSRRDRADDAAETAARRKDVVATDKAAQDRAVRDKATRDAAAEDGVRKDIAAKSAAAAGATSPAADPDAAQAEAVRAAAGETAETDDGDEPVTEGDAPDGTPTLIPAALAAPAPTAPAPGTAAAPGGVPTDPGGDAAAIQPAATPADPRIAALLAEASKGGPKDQTQEGGAAAAPDDGLAAPDPSAPAPQAKGADAATPAAAESRPAVSVQAPLSAVPLTIGMRALAGSNRFEIRLDPYELGRIDVRLDIDRRHGAVKAHLVVERPETLALLQRDAASLQQALSQAGLDPGEAGLSFSLRDGGGQNPQRDQAGRAPGAERATPVAAEAEAQGLPPLRNLGQRLGLDLRI